MIDDPRGIPVTTEDPRAVDALEAAIGAMLGHRANTGDRLAAVVAADPDLVAGRALRGFGFALLGRSECQACARDELDAARAALTRRGGTRRERLLVVALGRFVDGPQPQGMAALEAILAEAPRDALAAKLAHAGWFVLGRPWAMRRVTEAVLPAWSDALPGHSFLLGCHGFALEETGDCRAAETFARRAVERDPTDLWAGHAVGHVLEMEGRVDEGIAWLRSLGPHTGECNNLRYHVHWHEALFHLARGDHDAVLDLYDRAVRAEPTDDYRDHSNGVTLLWRLEAEGVDVGDRWEELADIAEARSGDHTLGFAVAHYALALVGAGRMGSARAFAERLRAAGHDRHDGETGSGEPGTADPPQRRLLQDVALPMVDAFIALGEHRAGDAVALLYPRRHRVVELGGSHAQRDVFTQLLVDAALAAGAPEVAVEVLRERARGRGPNVWNAQRRARAERLAHRGDAPESLGLSS